MVVAAAEFVPWMPGLNRVGNRGQTLIQIERGVDEAGGP